VNTNGQSYANTHANCTPIQVPVTLYNMGAGGTQTFYVEFTRNGTGSYHGFSNIKLAPGESHTEYLDWGFYDVIEIEVKSGDILDFMLSSQLKTGNDVFYYNKSITSPLRIDAGYY